MKSHCPRYSPRWGGMVTNDWRISADIAYRCILSQITCNCYSKVFNAFNAFKVGSLQGIWSMDLLDPFSCQLHHIAFDRLKSHTPFPCPGTQSINIHLKFHCVYFTIANTVISKKSYFRLSIWWDVIYVQREQQGTKNGALWGHPTKPEPSQILLHLQQLIVWSKEKNLSISMSCHQFHSENLLLRSSWGGVSNAFSKSNMNASSSTWPLLSKILAQSFITVVNWVSQLYPFLNACCLSDKSLYSSRWAEHTMCSSNFQGTQVKETAW